MSSLTYDQAHEILQELVALFEKEDAETFAAMCTPKVVYRDHAFQLTRQGRKSIKRHIEIWLHTNPGFTMEIEHFYKTERGTSIRFVSKGAFKNALAGIQPTGKQFVYRGVLDVVFDDNGLIDQVDEYYTKTWYEGIGVENFNFQELV